MVKVARSLGVLAIVGWAGLALAQDPLSAQQYIKPPKAILDAVMAPWHLNVTVGNLSPDRSRFIVAGTDGMPPLSALAKPYVNLGGLQVDLRANRARRFTTRNAHSLRIVGLDDGKELPLAVPEGLGVSDPSWSPDGSRVAFLGHTVDATRLYIADAKTGKVRLLTRQPLLATLSTAFVWIERGKSIATVLLPQKRPGLPPKPDVAVYPRVRVSDGKPTRIRTYPSLLDGPFDEKLLEYATTGQLAVIDASTGSTLPIGKPAMISGFDPSPAGDFFRVTVMEKPFSYIVPLDSFPQREVIWDVKGQEKAEISKRGLRVGESPAGPPSGGGQTMRSLTWRPDGAGLSFLRYAPLRGTGGPPSTPSEDEQGRRRGGFGGQTGPQPQRRDRVMLWVAPFGKDDVKQVYENETGISSVTYSADCKTLFLTQTVGSKTRLSVVRLGDSPKPLVLAEYDPEDISAAPGDLVTKPGDLGGSVARMSADGKAVYLSGTTYSKKPMEEAPRPFIDRVDLADVKKTRIFESKADVFEQPTLLDDEGRRFLVTRQSASLYPNTFLVDRRQNVERAITQNKDYLPDITAARREIVPITRPDGFKFEARVWVPRYAATGRSLPAFFWFYPGEFTDQAAFDKGKRTANRNLFPRVGAASVQLFLRAGYVVVEPDCPIVGAAGRQNDGYVPQLRDNLSATIDELDRRQLIDRRRLGIGGHSYGAFSTANALVHTPFFKAGIAGDGNYNRSLTPFGFQSEGRQIWEDRELYREMSPFLYAERMTGALLMYHGMDDQNVGTDPINSERMFAALEALGKPAAMYMYPYEDHGQIALESRLDIWARWVAWLDKYVKGAVK